MVPPAPDLEVAVRWLLLLILVSGCKRMEGHQAESEKRKCVVWTVGKYVDEPTTWLCLGEDGARSYCNSKVCISAEPHAQNIQSSNGTR